MAKYGKPNAHESIFEKTELKFDHFWALVFFFSSVGLTVKKTGLAKVHKGEVVITTSTAKALKHIMKK